MSPPKPWFQDGSLIQPTSIVVAAGAVAYSIVGLAYETFYSGLGVNPREVGLGYSETLITAASGLFLYLLLFAALTLWHAGINLLAVGRAWQRLHPEPRPADTGGWRWWSKHGQPEPELPSAGTQVQAWWSTQWKVGLAVVVAVALLLRSGILFKPAQLAVLCGIGAFLILVPRLGRRTDRRKQSANLAIGAWESAGNRPRSFIWTAAIAQVAGVHLVAAMSVALARGFFTGNAPGVGVLYLAVLIEPWISGWLLMRRYAQHAESRNVPARWWLIGNRLAIIAAAALGVALATVAVGNATQNLRAARDGRTAYILLDGLTNGRVDCIAPIWTGSQPAPKLPPVALFLGQAAGRIVLYQPGVGSIRLNSTDVALLPTAEGACETSRSPGSRPTPP